MHYNLVTLRCISLAEARYGLCGWVQTYYRKRLLTLFLDDLESGQFHVRVKNEATVDALWTCISFTLRHNGAVKCYIFIFMREASALLVLL